jgi:hypothetical protein
MILGDHLGGYTFEPPEGDPGYPRMLAPDRRPYQTKDGYVCALIYNDKQWARLLQVIGRPEMAPIPSSRPRRRAARLRRAYAFVAEEMKKRTTAEWLGGARGGRHPGAAHEHARRHRGRSAPRRDRFLPHRRAPERGQDPLDGRALEWSESRPSTGATRRAWASTRARCCAEAGYAGTRSSA